MTKSLEILDIKYQDLFWIFATLLVILYGVCHLKCGVLQRSKTDLVYLYLDLKAYKLENEYTVFMWRIGNVNWKIFNYLVRNI